MTPCGPLCGGTLCTECKTGIHPSNVTAVLITRGDQPEWREEREKQFERLGMDYIVVISPDIYTRYMTAERYAQTTAVFFQDDDVELTDEQILTLCENYLPGQLVVSMFDNWIETQGYFDLALVGLGGICDNGLWRDAFARWLEAYPDEDGQHRLAWDADFIFGVLARWVRFDIEGEQSIIMDVATDASRLSLQPGQHERKFESIAMARKLRTITGAVMAKNEEQNIRRAIMSVAPMVTSITLFDTGSTDHTVDVARATCEAEGLGFHLIEGEFKDFGTSRNELLREARNHGDYFLMFDADEEWHGDKVLPPLQLDIHIVNYGGPVTYGHPRIINRNFPCWFEGEVHSALAWTYDARGMVLENLAIEHHGDFTHGGDIEGRLRKDIALLSDAINNSRDVAHNTFMRAKAYEGLGESELARKDYEARLAYPDEGLQGIPAEQRYYAAFRLGVLLVEKFGQFADGADLLMTAWLYRPSRIESIRVLARYLNAVADATPIPESDILFVHRDEYKSDPKEG